MKIKHATFYFGQPPYSESAEQDQTGNVYPAEDYEELERKLDEERLVSQTLLATLETERDKFRNSETARMHIQHDLKIKTTDLIGLQVRFEQLGKVNSDTAQKAGYWFEVANSRMTRINNGQLQIREALEIYRTDARLQADQSDIGVRLNHALDALAGRKGTEEEGSPDVQ